MCPAPRQDSWDHERTACWLPYHSVLQLLGTPVWEDGQSMVKGNDHKGGEGHILIMTHQAPLVRRERGCQARVVRDADSLTVDIPRTLACSYLHVSVNDWTWVVE